MSSRGATGPSNLSISCTHPKFLSVFKGICLSHPLGLLPQSLPCALQMCYVPPPEVHSLLNFFSHVKKWNGLIMHGS